MLTRCLEEMRQDSRHAARMLLQHPSFTAAAVLSLALGIGANTAIFSVVDAALLNPLPYREPDRLIAIHGTSPKSSKNAVSYPNFLDMRTRTRTFEEIAAWFIEMFTLAGQPQAERLIGGRVSASYFSILRVQPLLGRRFEAREDQRGLQIADEVLVDRQNVETDALVRLGVCGECCGDGVHLGSRLGEADIWAKAPYRRGSGHVTRQE